MSSPRDATGRVRHVTDDGLPPLAPPDAPDDERGRAVMARMVARFGAPTLRHYRDAYAGCGAPWPGDDEIRRRHPVAPDTDGPDAAGAHTAA